MRIMIAEDSVLLREGLIRLLAAEGHDVQGYGTAEDLIAAVDETTELVITDIRMPPGHGDEGLRAAILLRRLRPGLPVLVLSQYIEQSFAVELFADGAGGLGYLLKDRIGYIDDFLASLDRIVAGGTVIDPEVVAQLLTRTSTADALAPLSAGEREVLALMAEGRSNAAIADRLIIAAPTVEKRISAIFAKFNLPPASEDHRRVLAVLKYLDSTSRKH